MSTIPEYPPLQRNEDWQKLLRYAQAMLERYEKHWPQTVRRGLLAIGDTEAEAWCRAVQDIEMREGH